MTRVPLALVALRAGPIRGRSSAVGIDAAPDLATLHDGVDHRSLVRARP
jgi:hypothetical protein